MVALNSNRIIPKTTVIFALAENLGSTNCDRLQAECNELQDGIREGSIRHLVIDCSNTQAFGCTALGLLLRLWKTAQRHGGTFRMCGLSPLGIETLRVVKLNRLWPIHSSLAEATADLG